MDMQHQLGDIINQRYHITDTLGEGAIGITYKARDAVSGVDVALKSLTLRQSGNWKAVELFEREAKILANLHHQGIPQYLDYFQVDSPSDRQFYIVQQIAPGESLATLISQGWHPTELEVRDIAVQMLRILIYLQSLHPPVIHQDIKPQNIIRHPDGQIFLVDFGTVRDTYRQTHTGGSTIIGTYGYTAPEQFLSQTQPATDLYGLGTTLLFLLTHRHPADLPQKRLKIDFRPATDISADFASWLDRMLEPAPEDRFTTAAESLAVLQGKRDIIYPPESSSHPPAGSKIVFQRTADSLFVDIPPAGGCHPGPFLLGLLAIFCICMTVLCIANMNWFWGIILLGLSIFIRLAFVGFFYNNNACQLIEINLETVKISWCWQDRESLKFLAKFFRSQDSSVKFSIEDVEMVMIQKIKTGESYRIYPIIVVGITNYGFGTYMHPKEQDWLVKQLADFMKRPYLIQR
ncbi:MAG: hypothetical protein Fur0025_02530 [Oscillatoriaceae cyanobacterium]